ncbi:MAG: hypothetical protein ACRCTY_01255, partial [Candidatus Adiutrix sp.]
ISAASRLLETMYEELPMPPDKDVWENRFKNLALAKRVECAVRENGSGLGLAPLEVHLAENDTDLKLTGFVHNGDDETEALRLAAKHSEGREIKCCLKHLQLHNDLVPPHCWK